MNIFFNPVWFDSLGAKSSCLFVKTDDIRILIDPGIAIMHQTFSAFDFQKLKWFKEGFNAISLASSNADVLVISHYHYDHFIDFQKGIYDGKTVFVKNPNGIYR
jgi:predicted metallo-beta-lactamase superfamily hydrolase